MEIRDAIIFTSGFITGTVAAYFAVKDKFESLANEEIAAMKEYYTSKTEQKKPVKNETANKKAEVDIKSYSDKVERVGYDKIPKNSGEVKNVKEDNAIRPYVISSEEFEMDGDYEKEMLVYYAGNDYLVDEDADEAFEIGIFIGREALEHFGDEIDQVVYVRNERLRTDYEVHRIDGDYTDENV